ncbi:NAD(+)/NADH kinase [Acanthamoeba castellanii str. Neff]|uniref:NAD(+)/NADH kinase n=1 Tax=Acanthamoeba castellanii (strain ATCC 30010 / Neff) TaxID=1257118 RepID=L8H3V3_ACACF|nr:NAD(+)/NADH kinase [Acanthamoeba castellanii str. Neff]ELR20179.1 NAD(+)/NADH kinase [Acanthamoeba castellanii str. Neff]
MDSIEESGLAQFRARKAKGRSRKILVRWSPAGGSTDVLEQAFRLVDGYTFGSLLHDALEHFGLQQGTASSRATTLAPTSIDESSPRGAQPRFELRDADGSVWPLLARIEAEITEDDLLLHATNEPQPVDYQGTIVWPVVCLVETGPLGRRSLAKASKKKSHESRSAGRADSNDEGANGSGSGTERKKKGSKVRRAHSETPVLPQQLPIAAAAVATPSAVSSLLSTAVAGDVDQQQYSASPPSTKSAASESERRRLSSSQPGMAKRHSSETLYKGPLRSSPVSSVLDGTAATTTTGAGSGLQLLDLEHVAKSKKRSGGSGDVARLQSPVSSGEVSPEREGASSDGGGGKNSPRRKDQAPHDEERKKEKTSPEPETVSPRQRQPSPRDKSESDEQSESEAGGSTPKKSSATGKLYAEITRGVRTHLRAASDSLRDHDRTPPVTPSSSASSSSSSLDERDTSEKADNHHRESSNKEKREKKEKHDKKENVIVRLFGSERHHKDKGPASSASSSAGSTKELKVAAPVVVSVVRDEVEIQITGPRVDPADGDRRVLMVHSGGGTVGAGGVVTTLTTMPSPPVSPFPMHKSGIRLIKVDSEHCINLPLVNSEITAQKTSSKATKLLWEKPPSVVLIIKKPRDPVITQQLCALANWLEKEKKMTVLIEPEVQTREAPHLMSFTNFLEDVPLSNKVDFIITLGGDGTILHVNSLFPYSVPPVVSFALGSLGFLTPFDVAEFEHHLACVIRGEFCLTVRQRLEAQIFKLSPTGEFIGSPTYQCMNEVVIDRGPDSHLCSLECYCDGLLITTIQADGVIISSTTGSTAYSLSAGGTMCHPIVPAVCFTPICPHSLSCRPIMFPDSVTLRIQVPEDARTRGWVSFDGRTRTELNSREYVVIKISRWPIPCINKTDHIGDWFRSLCECLNWNNRQKQKAFPPPT